jgi:hypothetical protein
MCCGGASSKAAADCPSRAPPSTRATFGVAIMSSTKTGISCGRRQSCSIPRCHSLKRGTSDTAHHACTFHQAQCGGARWVMLGGIQGRALFIEDFAPVVLDIRKRWFPVPEGPRTEPKQVARFHVWRGRRDFRLNVESCGDPAGATNNSQGTNRSAVGILAELGIVVQTMPDANHIERRNFSIQLLAGFMKRSLRDGSPCFQVSDRFYVVSMDKPPQARSLLVDGLEAGYVWDSLSMARTASPNTRRPRKDGTYDHGQNTCEYAALHFAPASAAAEAGVFYTTEEQERWESVHAARSRAELRAAQRDPDPYDQHLRERQGSHFRRGRGGYN